MTTFRRALLTCTQYDLAMGVDNVGLSVTCEAHASRFHPIWSVFQIDPIGLRGQQDIEVRPLNIRLVVCLRRSQLDQW